MCWDWNHLPLHATLPLLVLAQVWLLLGQAGARVTDEWRQHVSCQEPQEVMDMHRWLRGFSIRQADAFYNTTSPRDVDQHDVTATPLHEMRCEGLTGRACNCPHKYELNSDSNRIPRVLVQARCCWPNLHRVRRWRVVCRDVHHYVRALRRVGCANGVYQYRQVWEKIPVGCSCFTNRGS